MILARLLLVVSSLVVSALALWSDFARPAPMSTACRLGLCHFDDVYSAIDEQDVGRPEALAPLLEADPANPFVWCVYGDRAARAGDSARARAAFEHAVQLGPNMPPVLVRAVNYYVG